MIANLADMRINNYLTTGPITTSSPVEPKAGFIVNRGPLEGAGWVGVGCTAYDEASTKKIDFPIYWQNFGGNATWMAQATFTPMSIPVGNYKFRFAVRDGGVGLSPYATAEMIDDRYTELVTVKASEIPEEPEVPDGVITPAPTTIEPTVDVFGQQIPQKYLLAAATLFVGAILLSR